MESIFDKFICIFRRIFIFRICLCIIHARGVPLFNGALSSLRNITSTEEAGVFQSILDPNHFTAFQHGSLCSSKTRYGDFSMVRAVSFLNTYSENTYSENPRSSHLYKCGISAKLTKAI